MGTKKRLYRAFPNRELNDINFENLGMHWTISPQFAEAWAKTTPNRNLKHIPVEEKEAMKTLGNRYRPKNAGVVLEGEADMDHSVKDTDKDAEAIRSRYDIHPFEPGEGIGVLPPEREITLRSGNPVKIYRAHEEVVFPTDKHFQEGFVIKPIDLIPDTIASRTTEFEGGGKEGHV